MKNAEPVYPGGWLGAGLAVLRLSIAGAALALNPLLDLGGWGQWLLAIFCVSLAMGVGTRWSALVGAVALIAVQPLTISPCDAIALGGVTALVLTGPGAFSIDARLWGRVRVWPRSSR